MQTGRLLGAAQQTSLSSTIDCEVGKLIDVSTRSRREKGRGTIFDDYSGSIEAVARTKLGAIVDISLQSLILIINGLFFDNRVLSVAVTWNFPFEFRMLSRGDHPHSHIHNVHAPLWI